MAAEITEITQSNQDSLTEILRILRRVEQLLDRFTPLIDQATTSPLATRRALRKGAGKHER